MEPLYMTPIRPWEPVNSLFEEMGSYGGNTEAAFFGDVFKNTVQQVYSSQADVENKQYLLSTGQLDDAHSLPIAEAKAALSVDLLISLRNKALESYNELIKISV